MTPQVSAVILTWNSARHLGRGLAALQKERERVPTEVIVVDNGSSDDSLAMLAAAVPDARVIRNPTNQGVARARNQGVRDSHARYVLFLDSDAEMAPGSLGEMVRFMDATPGVGIVGPKLIAPDGTLQFSCRQFPTLQGKVLRQLPLKLRRAIAPAADEEMHNIDRTIAQPVDYVIGACQLIRRDVIERIGPLDERMFYGPEDVDFCLRAWQAGWAVYYLPAAVAVHHEQRITRRRPGVLTLRHGLALAYYFWKHRYLWRRPLLHSKESERVIT